MIIKYPLTSADKSKAPVTPPPPASVPTVTPPPPPAQAKPATQPTRPAHPKKSSRKVIGVSCTVEEYELIAATAKEYGIKPGRYLLKCTMGGQAELLRGWNLALEKKLRDILAEKLPAKA